jgi:hypothetical protein
MPVEKTDNGIALFFARAPGQVADPGAGSGAVVFRGARSGNSKYDPATGRFAGGDTSKPTGPQNPTPVNRSGIPQGISVEEWQRRLDIVRQAARSIKTLTPEEATAFLKDRVNDLSKIDMAQFILDVRAHQLDDMTDLLDAQLRAKTSGRRQAKQGVHLNAPASWIKDVYGTLQDDEVASIYQRLATRGYSEKDLVKNVLGPIKDKTRKAAIVAAVGADTKAVKLDTWIRVNPASDEFVELDDEDTLDDEEPRVLTAQEIAVAFTDAIKEMPAPTVTVEPAQITVQMPPPTRKVVHRNAQGLIESVEEIPDA